MDGLTTESFLQLRGRLLRQVYQPLPLKKSRRSERNPKFGSVIENVKIDSETRVADYSSSEYTENTRTGHIRWITYQTLLARPWVDILRRWCSSRPDAFGVLPQYPNWRRNRPCTTSCRDIQASSLVTERGIVEPEATFLHVFRRTVHAPVTSSIC